MRLGTRGPPARRDTNPPPPRPNPASCTAGHASAGIAGYVLDASRRDKRCHYRGGGAAPTADRRLSLQMMSTSTARAVGCGLSRRGDCGLCSTVQRLGAVKREVGDHLRRARPGPSQPRDPGAHIGCSLAALLPLCRKVAHGAVGVPARARHYAGAPRRPRAARRRPRSCLPTVTAPPSFACQRSHTAANLSGFGSPDTYVRLPAAVPAMRGGAPGRALRATACPDRPPSPTGAGTRRHEARLDHRRQGRRGFRLPGRGACDSRPASRSHPVVNVRGQTSKRLRSVSPCAPLGAGG
jgi:hypothetical protein